MLNYFRWQYFKKLGFNGLMIVLVSSTKKVFAPNVLNIVYSLNISVQNDVNIVCDCQSSSTCKIVQPNIQRYKGANTK